jgi:sterol desaturase/sphingolipid hydroxylase (fatty acid hydroxylase superfamily)
MFENATLDRLTRMHWLVVPGLFVPGMIYLLVMAVVAGLGPLTILALAFSGWLTWTLTEYWLHRSFFHWEPPGKAGELLHFLVHGVHHRWPRDRYRLVMPLIVSGPLYFVFLWLWRTLMGDLGWAFGAGFCFGYMSYDVLHYQIHHSKSPWLRELRRHHLVHHSPQKGQHNKFGVSTTLWDHVFRTY